MNFTCFLRTPLTKNIVSNLMLEDVKIGQNFQQWFKQNKITLVLLINNSEITTLESLA
jgi:hypothetical protein